MTTNQDVIIEINQLSKHFGDYQALNDVTLTVKQGEVLALLGPNGAGKTTTINCLLGFLKPDNGQVRIAGIDPQQNVVNARKNLAYIPEQVALYPRLSGLENLIYFSKVAKVEKSEQEFKALLEQVALPAHAFNKPVNSYSKGMRQKVGIAIAIAKQAKALILDEPTSGLDPSASYEFSQLIQQLAKQGVAILMATHDLFRAQEDAHSVAILNQGRLVDYLNFEQIQTVQLESVYLKHIKAEPSC
ncbi:ABC transporter ATP-binding protein [Pseudoalteromonas sp. MMG012]|uniref:ABC transporter ATP-binding protein n=1 Tax=Pseudoalteromonas sp. MMG012 TaxID=2822686 RepID=UPI001B3A4867|nr:ABC transporter ATP-binding protein [Pseudoalteromonas sp. MMG012]MBQ4849487.1 ABC transporter ATP-binding protein [Pseudoalteromonas sp. MMG012]